MSTRKAATAPASASDQHEAEASLYLVVGEDEYRVHTHARDLVARLVPPADQALGLDVIEADVASGSDGVLVVRRALESLQTLGFLSGRKVVWLRNATFFGTGPGPGAGEDIKEAVESLTRQIKEGLPPGQTLVVSALKVFRGSAFYKACKAAGQVVEFDLPEKSYQAQQHAEEQAEQELERWGLKADRRALAAFLGKTGTDTRQIAQEVEKLSLYLGGRREVRESDVQEIVSPSRESAVWDLADAVGDRKLDEALAVLRQLLFQGESAMGLLIGLENRYRDLLIFQEALRRGWARLTGSEHWVKVEWRPAPDADRSLGALSRDPRKMHPFRAARLAAQARRFSAAELRRGHRELVAAHEAMVSESVPSNLQLEFLLIRLLAPLGT